MMYTLSFGPRNIVFQKSYLIFSLTSRSSLTLRPSWGACKAYEQFPPGSLRCKETSHLLQRKEHLHNGFSVSCALADMPAQTWAAALVACHGSTRKPFVHHPFWRNFLRLWDLFLLCTTRHRGVLIANRILVFWAVFFFTRFLHPRVQGARCLGSRTPFYQNHLPSETLLGYLLEHNVVKSF